MKRKLVSLMLVVSMTAAMVAGCGSDDKKTADNNAAGTEKTDDSNKEAASGSVYYLNFKPEQDEQWQDLAKEYTKETGVDVTVLTAASGEYEKTLKEKLGE